eukprot:c9995_g1_i1.p2 GENE.c9995_g1_i1~~c9995_g1_i1.p2  ORF type:complete len:119 (-),score=28.57 c9995_g1_i1:118-474(-)
MIKIGGREEMEDDEGTEVISYTHCCQSCGHEIASHNYSFRADETKQYYDMQCDLCGFGEDEKVYCSPQAAPRPNQPVQEGEEEPQGENHRHLAIAMMAAIPHTPMNEQDNDEEEEWGD